LVSSNALGQWVLVKINEAVRELDCEKDQYSFEINSISFLEAKSSNKANSRENSNDTLISKTI